MAKQWEGWGGGASRQHGSPPVKALSNYDLSYPP